MLLGLMELHILTLTKNRSRNHKTQKSYEHYRLTVLIQLNGNNR
jgi:hypothetical protein